MTHEETKQGPEPTLEEQLETQNEEFGDYRGEIDRLRQGLFIIAGAPASLSCYQETFHTALCRNIRPRGSTFW